MTIAESIRRYVFLLYIVFVLCIIKDIEYALQ